MAKVANQRIFDAVMERSMVVEMAHQNLDREIQSILADSDVDVMNIIRKGGNPKTVIARVERRVKSAYNMAYMMITSDLSKYIGQEVDFNDGVLKATVGKALKLEVPNKGAIRNAVLKGQLQIANKGSKTLFQYVNGLSLKETRQIRLGIQRGLLNNLSNNEIADFVYNSSDFTDPRRLTRSQMRTITRTALTDSAAQTSLAAYKANADIIESYKYVSTLDSRTSLICINHDGKIYPIEGDHPRPPLHFNCRSVTIPVVMDYEEINDKLKKRGSTPTQRASINGQVPADQNYEGWLRGQGPTVQNRILGSQFADIWRQGGVPLKSLISNTGRKVDLDTLERASNNIMRGVNYRLGQQAFTSKTDKISGKKREFIVEGEPVNQFDIIEAITGVASVKRAESQFINFFQAQSKSGSAFGRVNKKNGKPGEYSEWWDDSIGQYRVGTEISFDNAAFNIERDILNSRYKGQYGKKFPDGKYYLRKTTVDADGNIVSLRDAGGNIIYETTPAPKAYTKAQYTFIKDFTTKIAPYVDSNQRTVIARTLRAMFDEINSGKPIGNINAFLVKRLNTYSEVLRKNLGTRYNDQIIRTSIKELYRSGPRNELIRKIEREIVQGSTAEAGLLEDFSSVLQKYNVQDVDVGELSEFIHLTLARNLSEDATGIALRIGRKAGKNTPIIGLGTQINEAQLGYDLIDVIVNSPNPPFTLSSITRTVVDKSSNSARRVSERVLVITPVSPRWLSYGDKIKDARRASNLPQDRSDVKEVTSGQVLNTDGRPLKTKRSNVVTEDSVSQAQADLINNANRTALQPNNEYLKFLEQAGQDTDPHIRGILADQVFTDIRTGNVNYQFFDLLDLGAERANKSSHFKHYVDYRSRVYAFSADGGYNGVDLQKHLWQNAQKVSLTSEIPPWAVPVGSSVDDIAETALKFSSAEYIGGKKALQNTLEGRIAIFDNNRRKMENLGERLINGQPYSASDAYFLSQVDEPGGVVRVSIELAMIKRFKARNPGKPLSQYKSNLRIPQDDTASAIQWMSVLTKSRTSAVSSNVANNVIKKNAYGASGIRALNTPKVQEVKAFQKLDEADMTKIAKYPVMTSLYNVTRGKFRNGTLSGKAGQIRAALNDIVRDNPDLKALLGSEFGELASKDLYVFVDALSDAIDIEQPALGGLLRYLEKFGRLSGNGPKQSIRWKNPLTGDTIEYAIAQTELQEVTFVYNGRTYNQKVYQNVRDSNGKILIDGDETGRIAPPNIIHNIDGGKLAKAQADAAAAGRPFTGNHDAFYSGIGDYYTVNAGLKNSVNEVFEYDMLRKMIDDAKASGHLTQVDYDELLDDLTNGISITRSNGDKVRVDLIRSLESLEEINFNESIFFSS